MNEIQKKFVKDSRWEDVAKALKEEAIAKNVNKDKVAKLNKVITIAKAMIKGDNWKSFEKFTDELKKTDTGTGYKIFLEKARKKSNLQRIKKDTFINYAINNLGYDKEDLFMSSLQDIISITLTPTKNRKITKEDKILEENEIVENLEKHLSNNIIDFAKEVTGTKKELSVIEKKIDELEKERKLLTNNIICSYREHLSDLFPEKKVPEDLKAELNDYLISKAELEVKNAIRINFKKTLKDNIKSEVLKHALKNQALEELLDPQEFTTPRIEIRSDEASLNIRNKTTERNRKIEDSKSIYASR